MWKRNNQHVKSVGQRKHLTPRQDSNLWSSKHWAGALSTWTMENSRRARPYTRIIFDTQWRRQWVHQKSNRINMQNNNPDTFICRHCTTKRLWHEKVYFHVLWMMCMPDKIVFLFLNLDMVVRNSTLGNFAYIWQRRWDGIITMKIERMDINFLSDLFAGVTVLGSHCP